MRIVPVIIVDHKDFRERKRRFVDKCLLQVCVEVVGVGNPFAEAATLAAQKIFITPIFNIPGEMKSVKLM
jgi:hypothetical protein